MSDVTSGQPAGFWDRIAPGAKYPDINKRLKGLPDWLRSLERKSGDEESYGAAGLLPGLPALATPAAGLAGILGGSLAVPAAAAYGVGKIVAPEATDAAVERLKQFIGSKVSPAVKKASAIGSAYETGMAESIPGARAAKKWLLPEETQARMDKIKSQHPIAAGAGQVAGTVGQMAAPGMALGNVVKGAGFLPAVGRAALSAAPFSAATGLDVGATTGSAEEGVKAGLLSQAIGTGAGALAGAVAQWGPGLAEKLRKLTNSAEFGSRNVAKRALVSAFNKSQPFGSGPLYKVQNVEKWSDDMADYLRTVPRREGAIQELAKGQTEAWHELDRAWQGIPVFNDSTAGGVIKKLITADDIVNVANAGAGDTAAVKAYDILIEKGDVKGSLVGLRGYLRNMLKFARGKIGQEDANVGAAIEHMAHGVDQRIGEMAMQAAEVSGAKIDLAKLKKFYNMSMPLNTTEILENLTPLRVGMGSPTLEKAAIYSGLAGLGGAAGLATGGDKPFIEKLPNIAISSVLGPALMKGASVAGLRGLSALGRAVPAITRAAGPIAARAPEIGSRVGASAAILANQAREQSIPAQPEVKPDAQAVQAVQPTTPGEKVAAQTGAAAGTASMGGDTSVYKSRIAEQLRERWIRAGMEQRYPGRIEEFMKYANDQTGGFEPIRTAHLMYANPEERKKFLDALAVSEQLGASLKATSKMRKNLIGLPATGVTKDDPLGASNAQGRMAYENIEKMIADHAEKFGGKEASRLSKAQFERIMKLDIPQYEKRKAIAQILEDLGVSLNLVRQAGIA